MNVHYCVRGSVESDDSALLDEIERELPSPDEVRLANEFTSERIETDDGTEQLTARMTFERGLQGQAAAEYLYERVTSHPLGDTQEYSLQLYRTPEGGVTPEEVREWYEQNPDEQPVNEEGEPYVPNRWNPNNHIERQQ